jgi:zinc D-Ala-D-Ala carboxypeptidase
MAKLLTANFSEGELEVEGCEARVVDNARWLCENVLEPLRAHFGQPAVVTSGRRAADTNAATGGVKASFHLYLGTTSAADVFVRTVPVTKVFDWLRLESPLPFDKVILETDAEGNPQIVHIQADPLKGRPRTAWLGQTHGRSGYLNVQCKQPSEV